MSPGLTSGGGTDLLASRLKDNLAENCLQVDGAAQSILWLRLAGLGKRVEVLGQSWGNKHNIEEPEVVKEKKHTDCDAWPGL
ncbi:hypothetical protein L1987_40121 [Smallanthus sonchifolius]|uniref:Uncharacterized protein n=1 Tax=Smallanthus sonchifolius TaxID=185202 RepID=A0ACB9GSK9_9ASTR|nr:hypothetical protein L1987_40121 [Smallanthus sonchifolius]